MKAVFRGLDKPIFPVKEHFSDVLLLARHLEPRSHDRCLDMPTNLPKQKA